MVTYEELVKLNEEKLKNFEKEQAVYNQRKKNIADLAEQYGILSLPDEEIKLGFYQLVRNYQKQSGE